MNSPIASPAPMFPIMSGGRQSKPIPWSVLAPFEHRAQINHGQSLKRLSERGGLGHAEALAALRDIDREDVPEQGVHAVLALERLVAERLAIAAPATLPPTIGAAPLPPASLTRIDALARVYASSYASPHHITFTVEGLRELLSAIQKAEAGSGS